MKVASPMKPGKIGWELPTPFAALRMVCSLFELDMPQWERTLKHPRNSEKKPDEVYPRQLSRAMLFDYSKWSLIRLFPSDRRSTCNVWMTDADMVVLAGCEVPSHSRL
jgi:hypothetical protein